MNKKPRSDVATIKEKFKRREEEKKMLSIFPLVNNPSAVDIEVLNANQTFKNGEYIYIKKYIIRF